MTRLIANRPLLGEYGRVQPGQEFVTRDEIARELLRSGVACKPDPPKILYETKVIAPEAPEVASELPFRHGNLSDEEPAAAFDEGDQVFPSTDLPEASNGITHRRRRGRPRKYPK